MALLQNQTEALVKIQSINKDTLEKIFGIWKPVEGKVVGGLYNADTDGKKKALLHINPAGIISGLKIAAVLTGASGVVIVSDEVQNEQELIDNAAMLNLPLEFENDSMVNKTAHRKDLLLSLDELVSMAAKLMGEVPGILLSVDDDEFLEVSEDTEVVGLLKEDIKGVIIDHTFYTLENLRGVTAKELHSKSGVLHTISRDQCVVDLLKKEILTLRKKSCGKCVYCREGLYQCSQIVEDITNGRSKNEDVSLAEEISEVMTYSCNCSLGNEAGLPILSVYKNFAGELEEHTKRKECKTGVCLALIQIYIDPNKCTGCGSCIASCPKDCIDGKAGYTSVIDSFDCTRCGKCVEVCNSEAVIKTSGRIPKIPGNPMRLKGIKAVQDTTTEKKERTGTKRKRTFGSATGGVQPVKELAKETKNDETSSGSSSDSTVTRVVGKRKRVYARAKSSSDK